MQRATWDGTPLSGLVGRQIDVSGDHTLVLGDVSLLRPGLYLIRLSQGGRSQMARAVVMR